MPSHSTEPSPRMTAPETSESFPLRAYFSHHKCATGWTDEILREICYHMGVNFEIVSTPDDFPKHDTLGSFVEAKEVDFLSYINANRKYVRDLPLYRGFHVVRDPRDVLVSGYFSHKHSHPTDDWPELAEHRNALKHLSKSEGLFREMEFSRPFFEDMYSWDYDQKNVLELRMETLTSQPVKFFAKIGHFLDVLDESASSPLQSSLQSLKLQSNRLSYKGERFGLPLLPTPRFRQSSVPVCLLHDIVEQHRFERLTGRKQGEENVQSHYRKGVPGDWKNHFEDEHVHRFKDRYNDLLLKLGYEDDPDWNP